LAATASESIHSYLLVLWAQHGPDCSQHQTTAIPVKDLPVEIVRWKNNGCQVVVGLKANNALWQGITMETFARLGTREVICEHHSHIPSQATCFWNHRRKPINGIFATSGIYITAGGCFGFGEAPPSTRQAPSWIDVSLSKSLGAVLGSPMCQTSEPVASRLMTLGRSSNTSSPSKRNTGNTAL
jgi:hypothetical protein